MRVPYLGGALKGWTAKIPVLVVTKEVVDHLVTEVAASVVLDINYQPMPPAQVNRKPEEQRTWKWWTLIVKGPLTTLKTDDAVTIGPLTFRVQSARDWTTSGFSIYEAVEGFTPPPAVPDPEPSS